MKCSHCHGQGCSTLCPDGLCPFCRGTGYYSTDDYVRRNLDHSSRRAAVDASLRQTYGKTQNTELPAVK